MVRCLYLNRIWSNAMIQCKECQSDTIVKNGIVRKKQRYKCKSCGCNFIIGDYRINPATELKRHTCVLFYSLGKASFRFLAKLFDVSPDQQVGLVDTNQTGETEYGNGFGEDSFKDKFAGWSV